MRSVRIAHLGLAVLLSVPIALSAQEKGKAWQDLMPGADLQGWQRVPVPPDEKLADRNPWSVDAAKKVLVCDGFGVKEMLLYRKPVGDGVFHVEWRFRPSAERKDYNSGVYLRTAADGKHWLQVQVAMAEMPPQAGDVFFDLPGDDGQPKRVVEHGTGHKHVRPVGEWNSYDLICRGDTITVQVNGHEVVKTTAWPHRTGHIGLQAEYFVIEFRNLRWRKE